jgi:hypothetical protein
MLPSDLKDLITAFIFFILLVAGGTAIEKLESVKDVAFGDTISIETLEIDDDKELFVLSYLKVDVEDKKIKDLIRNSKDEEVFEELKDRTDEIFAFFGIFNYDVRIVYNDQEKKLGNLESTRFYEVNLPSNDGEIITVKLNYEKNNAEWI